MKRIVEVNVSQVITFELRQAGLPPQWYYKHTANGETCASIQFIHTPMLLRAQVDQPTSIELPPPPPQEEYS